MKDVQETLDRLVPEPARMSDWDSVLRQARPRRRTRAIQLTLATGVVALAALFVVAPWKCSERVGVMDKALAAVGDGPVVHVVFRGDWGGTLVDLKTGDRKPVYGERELWYDASRNLVHEINRFGGAVEDEEVYSAKKPSTELTSLSREYRKALEAGTARVTGLDVLDGVPVYWITVRRLMLPDVADHRDHEYAEHVAISRETFKPVATRATRDGNVIEGSNQRVLRLETVPYAQEDFVSNPQASLDGRAMMQGSDPIDLARAAPALGRTPYWLGPEHAGFPLVQIKKAFSATGISAKTLVTGQRAGQIQRCLRASARARMRGVRPTCRLPHRSVEIRDGQVYESGPVRFGARQTAVTFFYGKRGDDPTTFKKESVPLWTEPHVLITETTDRDFVSRGSPMKYMPTEGSVVLMPGQSGFLVRGGVYITIMATSEKLILDAARALRPMPSAGSGGGG